MKTVKSNVARTVPLNRDMVWIDAGSFLMGSDSHYPEEAPAHRVSVAGFWIDRMAVSNAAFARFVEDTGYVTMAERAANLEDYPDALPEMLAPASTVFQSPQGPVDMSNHFNWWAYVRGANWRHPRGPASSIAKLGNHPVVHLAYADVVAYADWAGGKIPSEAEWEFAARGGLEAREYAWGDEFAPDGKHMANTWQGDFPCRNSMEDGFRYTAPVRSFPPNGYGLFGMIGNVWEWTDDWYQSHGKMENHCCTVKNPRGGTRDGSIDVRDEARIPRKVTKGGSHLCAPNYCRRYRPAARMAQPVDTSTSHLGFRLVLRSELAGN